jgi:hypothetical protein
MLINGGYIIVPEAAAECSERAEADVGANNPVFWEGGCDVGKVISTCCPLLGWGGEAYWRVSLTGRRVPTDPGVTTDTL